MPVIKNITLFPVKGLNGQIVDEVEVEPGRGLIGDRRFAITTVPEVDGKTWKSSRSFLINAVDDNLLKLVGTREGRRYFLVSPDGQRLSVDLQDEQDIAAFNARLSKLLSSVVDPGSNPRLVKRSETGGPAAHWDYPDSQLSVLNLQTLKAVSTAIGTALDMRRFRGNLSIAGLPAWAEFGLCGSRYRLGDAEIEFTRPARRCPAIAVNPESGDRDIEVHKLISTLFGHVYFGVYARVVKAGKISPGLALDYAGPADLLPEDAMVEGASPYSLWPKLAVVESAVKSNGSYRLGLRPAGEWPLIREDHGAIMKLHGGAGQVARAAIIPAPQAEGRVIVALDSQEPHKVPTTGAELVITGPFGKQK